MGQRYRIMADQKPWSGLPKLKSEKSKLRDVLSKLVQLKHIAAGGLGAEPPAARSSESL